MPRGMYSSVRIEDGVAIKRVKRADWAAAEAAYGQTIMALLPTLMRGPMALRPKT